MRGTISNTPDNKKMLTINFNDADPIGDSFGRNDDICDVNETIREVKELFQGQIRDFVFPDPPPDQIRVDYVREPIDKINITWPEPFGNGEFSVVALNQSHRDNIFMTYPIKNNYISAKQLLSHEVGHWFFNRVVENRIGANDHRITRSDIHGYENNFTEKAAYYCEIRIAGNRHSYSRVHIDLINEIREAIRREENYLSDLLNRCLMAPRD